MTNKKLNIFTSAFGIRANLKIKEPDIYQYWRQIDYWKQVDQGKKDTFLLHIGPPYANGNIHIGHAMNFILKDFCLRFQSLNGKKVIALPGWDTHGLPIALIIGQKFPPHLMDPVVFRQKCREFANQQVITQTHQLQRLGTQINWNDRYLTFMNQYVADELRIFAQLVTKKLVFTSLKPVYWSWSSKTALAETEVEYLLKKTNSVFILFPFTFSAWQQQERYYFLVWTTTLWTISENKYLAVKAEAEYLLLQVDQDARKIIVAQKLLNKLKQQLGWKQILIIKSFQGKDFLSGQYLHPYLNLTSQVLHSDHVHFDEGTGIIHIAPAFGLDDFYLVKNRTTVVCPIDENGHFNHQTQDPQLVGLFYVNAEKSILASLNHQNHLFAQQIIKHQYPHDWRTKKPVIYRATAQWYLDLQPIKTQIISTIQKVQWLPQWGKKRMLKVLTRRQDWCLSRQRKWGTPLPIFFNSQNKPVLNSELIHQVADQIAKYGDNIWWEWPITKLLQPQQITAFDIKSKMQDTFDVWFDSGCSAQILYPHTAIDLIWEGNDQYRGWFNSLIIIASAMENKTFIRSILSHGFVNDMLGQKMSKSKGNVIDPLVVCNQYGADILRLWVASSNYFDDLNLGKQAIVSIQQNYVKIRNTIRFLINNLIDFNFSQNQQHKLTDIDHFILLKLNIFLQKATQYFHNYQFYLVFLLLNDFIVNDLSNLYFDYAKNILYPEVLNARTRRQIQTVFFHILHTLLVVLAPILPYTTEDAYQVFVNSPKLAKSVHYLAWPKEIKLHLPQQTKNNLPLKWHFLLHLKNCLHKHLEIMIQKKQIKTSRAISVIFYLNPQYQLFPDYKSYQKYCQKFNLTVDDDWQKNNDLFKEQVLSQLTFTSEVTLFLQVYNFSFSNERKGIPTDCGLITFIKNANTLCLRCNWRGVEWKKEYCIKCKKILTLS